MQQIQRVALHEAGHTIAAYYYRRSIRLLTVDANGTGRTYCTELRHGRRGQFQDRIWRTLVEQEIVICLAGPLAEPTVDLGSARVDLQMVRAWLRELGLADSAIRDFTRTTRDLLHQTRVAHAMELIAARLFRNRKLTGREVESICRPIAVPRASRFE